MSQKEGALSRRMIRESKKTEKRNGYHCKRTQFRRIDLSNFLGAEPEYFPFFSEEIRKYALSSRKENSAKEKNVFLLGTIVL